MDLEKATTLVSWVKCCDCECSCNSLTGHSDLGTWFRSVKRKYDEVEEGNGFVIPGFELPQVARVEIGNERDALREMVSSQQQTIQVLSLELEEERSASSSAANEAMSMILRLQREKAEIQMESRQFKLFVEEKMAHDQQELSAMEDLLYRREEAIEALYCEVHAYKHRMMSYGLTESEADGERGALPRNNSVVGNVDAQYELPAYDYPPLKCSLNEAQNHSEADNDVVDVEKYAFGETPCSSDHLKDLEYRINQLEISPRQIQPDGEIPASKNVIEKVIVGQSPRQPSHFRQISTDSSNSLFATCKEMVPDLITEPPRQKMEYSQTENYSNLRKVDNESEVGDDMSDRIYTIDSVQGMPYNGLEDNKPSLGEGEDYCTTPRKLPNQANMKQADVGDPEIKKLYLRLQALEADRESMRQALISMGTDKAQLVLLKEIAQHLCKEMPPARMPKKKSSPIWSFHFMSVFKFIVSFVSLRKKPRRSKYIFGMSAKNAGLLMLLDKGPRLGQWRCLSSTQVLCETRS